MRVVRPWPNVVDRYWNGYRFIAIASSLRWRKRNIRQSGADSRQSSLPEGEIGKGGEGRGKESMIIEIRVATVTRC